MLRMSIVAAGFYLIARGHWERLMVCLIGFFLARIAVTRFTRAIDKPAQWGQVARHAP
jgi:F1F0 ATPase subunit 2